MNSIIKELIQKRAQATLPYDITKRSKIDEERQFEEDIKRQERKDAIAFKRGTESLDDKRKRRRVDTQITKYVDTIQKKARAGLIPISELKLLQRVIERDIVPSDEVINKVNSIVGSINFDDLRGRPQDVVNAVQVAENVLDGLFTDDRNQPTSSVVQALRKRGLDGANLRDLEEGELRDILTDIGAEPEVIAKNELINRFNRLRSNAKIAIVKEFLGLPAGASKQVVRNEMLKPDTSDITVMNALAEAGVRGIENITEDALLQRLEEYMQQNTIARAEARQQKQLEKQQEMQFRIGERQKRRAMTEAERERLEKQFATTRKRKYADLRRRKEEEDYKERLRQRLKEAPSVSARKRRRFEQLQSRFDRMTTPVNEALEEFREVPYNTKFIKKGDPSQGVKVEGKQRYLSRVYGIDYDGKAGTEQMEADLIEELRDNSKSRRRRERLVELRQQTNPLKIKAQKTDETEKRRLPKRVQDKLTRNEILRQERMKEFKMTESPLFKRSKSRVFDGDDSGSDQGKGSTSRSLEREAERQLRERQREDYDEDEVNALEQSQRGQEDDEEEEGSGATYKQYRKLVDWFDREIEKRLL